MASLLEQAIIDAEDLKNAALKNAENKILEKYSKQIKEAVDSILDDEEGDDIPGEKELLIDDELDAQPEGLGMEDSLDPTAQAEETPLDAEIPSALDSDDEEIEINLDQLADIISTDAEQFAQDLENEVPDQQSELASELADQPTEEFEGAVDELKNVIEDLKDVVDSNKEENEVEYDEFQSPDAEKEIHSNAPAQNVAGPIMEEVSDDKPEEDELSADDILSSLQAYAAQGDEVNTKSGESELAVDLGEDKPEPHGFARNVTRRDPDAERRQAIQALKESKEKVAVLTKELDKYRKAVKMIAEKAESINLLNAKLVYKNKALSDDALNNRQRKSIVESIGKASSINEAKLVYEAFRNAIKESKTKRGERFKKTPPSLLREVNHSKFSQFAEGKDSREEEFDLASRRMMVLAGIKK